VNVVDLNGVVDLAELHAGMQRLPGYPLGVQAWIGGHTAIAA